MNERAEAPLWIVLIFFGKQPYQKEVITALLCRLTIFSSA
jgi:hypothetical protein